MRLHPPQDTLAPGIHQAQEENEDKDAHFNEPEARVSLKLRRPWKDEHRLHVENDEEQGEDVIADLALRPTLAYGIHSTFIGELLLTSRLDGAKQRRDPQQKPRNQDRGKAEPDHGEKRPEEERHQF